MRERPRDFFCALYVKGDEISSSDARGVWVHESEQQEDSKNESEESRRLAKKQEGSKKGSTSEDEESKTP